MRLPDGGVRRSGSGTPPGYTPGARTPASLDLTAAARYVVVCQADQDLSERAEAAWAAARDMWEALTGLADRQALAYAHTLAEGRQVTAVVPPF